MKKNIVSLIILLFITIVVKSQVRVGIGTNSPLKLLHIDAAGDTQSNGNLSIDDVIIESTTGNLGVGTISPTQKLDVNGTVRVRGGNPTAGKVLTSLDNKGNGVWRYATSPLDTKLIRIIPGSSFTYQAGIEYTLANFMVSTAGNYIAIFRWWGVIDNPAKLKNVHFRIYVNGTLMDQVEHYMTTQDHRNITCFSTAVYAMNTPANTTVKITANFVNDSHTISKYILTEAYNPSIVFFGI